MADREVELGCDLLQGKSSAEIRLELFAGALRLPRSKAAARRSAARPQSAIRLSDVCRERKHHVIDEKLVRFGRPTQSPQQRRADVRHNLVVEAGAELTVELADAPEAE